MQFNLVTADEQPEVRHADGTPPYVVRWSDTGYEALVYPGADAFVQHTTEDERESVPEGPGHG